MCADLIATYEVEKGKPYIDPKFHKVLQEKVEKSSLSLIHYFAVEEANEDDTLNDSNAEEVKAKSDKKDKVITTTEV